MKLGSFFSLLCYAEIDGVQTKADLQPEISGKCPQLAKYTFNTKLFIEEHEEEKEMVTISKGVLRVYVQMQSKIDEDPGRANVTITTKMVSNAENTSTVTVTAVKKISITRPESSNWTELPVNEELQQLYPLMTPDAQIVFELTIEAGCSTEGQVPMVQLPGLAEHEHQTHLVIFVDRKESKIDRKEPEINTPEQSRHEETVFLQYLFRNYDFKRSTGTASGSELCERQAFDAVFNDLGLDVILAPYSADIGACSGSCSHLSSSVFRASVLTNYALLLQSAIGSGEADVPQTKQPCCVPSKFSGLYLIIRYPDATVALRFFPDAVVAKCKCTI